MKEPILYVIINGELNMSAGKAAAQAVHATMMLTGNYDSYFSEIARRTVIILEAKNSQQIKNLHEYLTGTGIFSAYYIDEGFNEVDAYSITALAVEPFDASEEEKRAIFYPFQTYNGADNRKEITQSYLRMKSNYHKPRFVKKTLEWLKEEQ